MFHFKKVEETFGSWNACNPALKELKTIGVDMEIAIFTGFKIQNPGLSRHICVRHLKKRDEGKIAKLLIKTNQTAV